MKNILLGFLSITIIIFSLPIVSMGCNTTEPPPDNPKAVINLSVEDVSCTEAWINLKTENIPLPFNATLKSDSLEIPLTIKTSDTLLYTDLLLPNKIYNFNFTIQQQSSSIQYPEASIQLTTLDTTSHNFTWQTWTFGDIGSSVLYDVARINDNNIWAVGEIYMKDSLGNPDPKAYNAVHWDGGKWELKRIKTNACGGVEYPPIKTIFTFSAIDILFAHIDGSITYYDGIKFSNNCSLISQLNGSANKIWGTSINNYYVVSGNGFIAHYDGSKWTKIESETDLQFLDIYGAVDPKTNEWEILAVCTRNFPLDKGIYRIEKNRAIPLSSYPIQWELYALWFIPNRHYYVVGSGIYEKIFLSDSLWKNEPLNITRYGTTGIRGNGFNDVFVAGAFGEFLHFNGYSWKSYINETGWFQGSYGGIAIKGNMVITAGYEGREAKILLGNKK